MTMTRQSVLTTLIGVSLNYWIGIHQTPYPIIVVPDWKSLNWFSKMLSMVTSDIFLLPRGREVCFNPVNRRAVKIRANFFVYRVSGSRTSPGLSQAAKAEGVYRGEKRYYIYILSSLPLCSFFKKGNNMYPVGLIR